MSHENNHGKQRIMHSMRYFGFLIFLSSSFSISVSSVAAQQLEMTCVTKNIFSSNYSKFRFVENSVFRKEGSKWTNISEYENIVTYDIGDSNVTFLMKKRDGLWWHIFLDFKARTSHIKNCDDENCESIYAEKTFVC